MKIRSYILIFVSILSTCTYATTTCDYQSGNGSNLIADLTAVSEEFRDGIRGKTIFDRDGVTLTSKWGWSNTGSGFIKPTMGGVFFVAFDNSIKNSSSFTNTAIGSTLAVSQTIGGGRFGGGVLTEGPHEAYAKVDYQSGQSCTDKVSFSVEKTQILGQLSSAESGGIIKGFACIKGIKTGRIGLAYVDLWAGPGDASNQKLSSVKANISSGSNECGTGKNYELTLTERQQQDYCDQPLWVTVKDASGNVDTVLSGSQNYLVPCAKRPYVATTSADKNGLVQASGSNFKNGTTVELRDTNGSLWASVPVSYINAKAVNFSLPDLTPPSRCNKNSNCTIKARFYNPDGKNDGIYTEVSVNLVNLANASEPTIGAVKVSSASSPLTVTLDGVSFQLDSTVDVYDTNGNYWNKGGYGFTNSSSVTFRLPADTPPSNCNRDGPCQLSAVLKSYYLYSKQGLKDYVEKRITFTIPKVYANTVVAAGDNLKACSWTQTNYVGSDGPNTYSLFCSGYQSPVLTKVVVGGGCYLGAAAKGFYLLQSNSSCAYFVLYKVGMAPPSSVLASISGSAISLTWGAVSQADSYKIYRNATYLKSVTATSFLDASVAPGNSYSYQVKACLGDNCSELSNWTAYLWVPTSNTTSFTIPLKDGMILGVDAKYVAGTTYFSTDTQQYVLDSTAFQFCKDAGYIGASSYQTGSNYGNGHKFAVRGNWWVYGGGPFTQITLITCFK